MKLVPIKQLTEGMILFQDVYTENDSVVPLLRGDTIITQSHIDKLCEHQVERVCIVGDSDEPPFIVPNFEQLVSIELQNDAVACLEKFFDVMRSSEGGQDYAPAIQAVKKLDNIVDRLLAALLSDADALININELKSYDEYTYHHSLSVAVLAIAVANNLGMGIEEIRAIGRCAIMHDIGKTAIPIEIINKPSRLDEKEFALIKNHSSKGFEYLVNNGIGDNELWQGVLCHHEKYNGEGYPFGFKGEEIPLASRIITVADVYDALTSCRPYRSPMLPAEAIEYIMAGVDTDFDYNIVNAFIEKIELYPVGSLIELSNGEQAIVLGSQKSLRPIVKLVSNGFVLDLYNDTSCLNITIKNC